MGQPLSVTAFGTGCVVEVRVWLTNAGVSGRTQQSVGFPDGFDFAAAGHVILKPTLLVPGTWHVYAGITDSSGQTQQTGLIRVVTVSP